MTPDERDALILSFQALARSVVAYLRVPPRYRDDAFGDAMVGVIEAIDSFNPELGRPLPGWVWFKCWTSIQDGVRYGSLMSHNSVRYAQRHGVDLSLHSVEQRREDTGWDVPSGEADLAEDIARSDELQWVRQLIAVCDDLPLRHRQVMLAHLEGRSYFDIAADIGVTESRVSQIAKQARERLRPYLEGEMARA